MGRVTVEPMEVDHRSRLQLSGIRDRRFFIAGVFLLLLALGSGEEPLGDPGSRLVITKHLLTEGRLHLPSPQRGLVETAKGWTSYFAIGQILLFVPFEIAGGVLSLLSPNALAPHVRNF